MTRRIANRVAFAALLGSMAASCTDDAGLPAATREIRSDGTVFVRYSALPEQASDTITPDLRIGAVSGSVEETFGRVGDIAVGSDGTIYVLDIQAMELRAFGPDGRYLATLARRGSGPAELSRPTGMALAPDGTVWVHDPFNTAIIGLSPQGGEVARLPRLNPARFAASWDGVVDRAGRFWQTVNYAESSAPPSMETQAGEGAARFYYKSYQPAEREPIDMQAGGPDPVEAYDSVLLGAFAERYVTVSVPDGRAFLAAPFDPRPLFASDLNGGIWLSDAAQYRVARVDLASGDTTIVIDADLSGPRVSAAEREDQLARADRYRDQAERVRDLLADLMPERKPVVNALLVDDVGRLWVGRTVYDDDLPMYDVFTNEGDYLGSVRLPGDLIRTVPLPVVRTENLYAVIQDSLGVQYVTRAALPGFLNR